MKTPQSSQVARFGPFELNLRVGELRRNGTKIRLQEQSFQILAMLLEYPGELVTREDLQKKLWPNDTIVEFENSINAAIRRLRLALGDSADNPRFVETLPRRGYRFVFPVDGVKVSSSSREVAVEAPAPRVRRTGQVHIWMAGLALLVLVAVLAGLNVGDWRERLLRGESTAPIRSLAVLPLDNLSDEPEHFTVGMTEALTTELGKISALRVISHTSAKKIKDRLKETDASLSDIAQEFNLGVLVEGSVLRSDGRIRIDVQLIQANPELHLWAESYERDLRNVLALQSEIARAIAEEIKVAVTPEEELRLASTPPVNLEAHERYLMGRHQFRKGGLESHQRAVGYFEEAIRYDPNHALYYAGLAGAYISMSTVDLPPAEVLPQAEAAARKALELDPMLAEAHAWMGRITLRYHYDFEKAEEWLLRALELNPNSARVHIEYSRYLAARGRAEESSREIQAALRLDPVRFLSSGLGFYPLLASGKYDQVISRAQKVLELEPNLGGTRSWLALAYTNQGRNEEALREAERARQASGDAFTLSFLGEIYAEAGMRDEAREVLSELIALSERRYVCPYLIGCVYLALDDMDKAFEFFHKTIDLRSG